MKSKYIYTALLPLFMMSCNSKETVVNDFRSYVPYEQGQERIFRIHLVTHNGFDESSDTTLLFQKEHVEYYFNDNEGDSSFRLGIYLADDQAGPWTFDHYEYISFTSSSFELIRDNRRLVKMLYPIKNLKVWNENEFNVLPTAQNRYRDIGFQKKINDNLYSNTILVDGDSINDPILFAYRKSIYAYNIGLIYEDDVYRQKQNDKYEGQEIRKVLVDHNF